MQITVNGEAKEFSEDQVNVTLVLTQQNVESPDMVAVQVNGAFVDKGEFDQRVLQEGDSVEFLYFMGGGAV
ncbi:sulfur carrier protein ThiS [Desulfurivibrio alkaliphilus]|uniref:Thiamine biosynthesis protein ThiS n=1 Tax=Desulfurivibrio alkaliphilus (strain DSM 19089 / UNIQEM U267 / AHT2) TaxID=589865 RepID=D6Z201_DESAT|nr:sulfur carrier protein ThiS [Desulfurivibrio alkaliphilus]ADH85576.1 thiamine biosynthesis protein ThiS [Desulfurivibrio alkaliphilus AHT 2]